MNSIIENTVNESLGYSRQQQSHAQEMAPGELSLHTYWGIDNTLKNIKQLIREFKNSPEVAQFDRASLTQIFDYVRNLPYVPDPNNFEWLQSPRWTLYHGGDCDDKAILIGAIFERRGQPYRMSVVSTQADKELHHIYPEIYFNNAWYPFDATYDYNQPFEEEPFTVKRVYEWFGTDRTKTYEQHFDSENISRQRSLAGNLAGDGPVGESVRLAILRGNLGCGSGACECGGQCSSCSHTMSGQLGFDPGVIIAAGSVLFRIFGGFGRDKYTGAYTAWSQIERTLPGLAAQAGTDPQALAQLSASRAIIAVLSRDYMNAPMGANFCSNPSDNYYCGNRAQWDVIQPEVMQKAQDFAPFMLWLNGNNISRPQGWIDAPMGLDSMVGYYDQWKSKSGPLYQQFVQTRGRTNAGTNNAGTSWQKMVPIALAAAAIYFLK